MGTVSSVEDPAREWARLKAIEQEYRVTIRVLAILAERLLQSTQGQTVVISDEALADTPDLVAYRDAPAHQVVISVAR